MELDPWAITYGCCLLASCALGLRFGGCARGKGAAFLATSWIMTLVIQNVAGTYITPIPFAWLDFTLFLGFGLIGKIFARWWAWAISGIFLLMLTVHLAAIWAQILFQVPVDPVLYTWVLSGLAYIALLVYDIPLVVELWREDHVDSSRNYYGSLARRGFNPTTPPGKKD